MEGSGGRDLNILNTFLITHRFLIAFINSVVGSFYIIDHHSPLLSKNAVVLGIRYLQPSSWLLHMQFDDRT